MNIDVYYSSMYLQITDNMCNTQRGIYIYFLFFGGGGGGSTSIIKYLHITIFLLYFQHITPAQ